MSKIQSREKRKGGYMDFKVTFQLTLYLQDFKVMSLAAQGLYYITASLCPKNAVIMEQKCPCESQLAKIYSTRNFKIKYSNQIEYVQECACFTFSLSQNLSQQEIRRENRKDNPALNHTLVIGFDLMRKDCAGDFDSEQSCSKFEEDYKKVGFSSLEMIAKDQISFAESFNVNFRLPYSAVLSGTAICLIKSVEPIVDFDPLLETKITSQKEKGTKEIREMKERLLGLKKNIKKQMFTSYITRKNLEKSFNQSRLKSKFSIRDGVQANLKEGNLMPLKFECGSCDQKILEFVTIYQFQERGYQEMLSDLNHMCQQNTKFHSDMIQFLQAQKQTSVGFCCAYLKEIHQSNQLILYQEKIKSDPRTVNKTIFSKTLDTRPTPHEFDVSIEIQPIADSVEYLKLDSQLSKNQENSELVYQNASEEMKKLEKNVLKLKSRDMCGRICGNKFFTPLNRYFNLIPGQEDERYDQCPFMFHSSVSYPFNTVFPSILLSSKSSINSQKQCLTKNIFIMAHGYQANSQNLEILKVCFKNLFHDSKFLLLSSYEGFTNKDIRTLGELAAKEIEEYMFEFRKKSGKKPRIIFVGHSMGGIILRASLKHLTQSTLQMLHTYISFATPHLGYLNSHSMLTDAGMKLIQSINSSMSLKQISNRDHQSIKDTFIYELSQTGRLTYFKHIILFSSLDDKYVPWNSARIQIHKQARGTGGSNSMHTKSHKNYMRCIQQEMMNNILGMSSRGIKNSINSVQRFQVDFNITECGIDSLIGRTAHVAFLVNKHIVPMVMLGCLRDTVFAELSQN